MATDFHFVHFQYGSLEVFDGYGLLIFLVMLVTEEEETLKAQEVRGTYVGQPTSGMPNHEQT